ncbi:hypothetical protein V2J09_007126 [Rumex salicifolius]
MIGPIPVQLTTQHHALSSLLLSADDKGKPKWFSGAVARLLSTPACLVTYYLAMDYHKKTKNISPTNTTSTSISLCTNTACTKSSCFFCILKETRPSIKRAKISLFLHDFPLLESHDHVNVLSGLWNLAMTYPDDPEFPSLGVFECMASLIEKGVRDRDWLLRHQNIYTPYYAAHVIGSYTMNRPDFSQKAVQGGVIPPLMELLRGKISWVEQRVAVRALGHIASYESTFEALAEYEEEVVKLAMDLASCCLDVIYKMFVAVQDSRKRLHYHCDLLTRGIGGLEMENRKAEEWASQLQCWSLYLLNCFAYKSRSVNLICSRKEFLKQLCGMWGGLVNDISPAGFGLIRILCYSKDGRKCIAELGDVIESLTNLSRSSDDWQYIGIDCLLLLLKDPRTRPKVIDAALLSLSDLIELKSLGERSNVGEAIINIIVSDHKQSGSKKAEAALEEVLAFMDRRRQEKIISKEKIEERRASVDLIKKQGNESFCSGNVEEAIIKYSEALDLCPLRLRKERVVLYSNRAQCYLLMRDVDAVIRDTTRALCLTKPPNSHGKSLWRRSQAYDMKGLARESLLDCIMYVNCFMRLNPDKYVKIPHYAAKMIGKQMEATWLFRGAEMKSCACKVYDVDSEDGSRMAKLERTYISGLSTILEEPLIGKVARKRLIGSGSRRYECSRSSRINISYQAKEWKVMFFISYASGNVC